MSSTKDTSESSKKAKKPPKNNQEDLQGIEENAKKISTKEMIHEALAEAKGRKGISLYAIKKFIEEKFNTDTKKIDYLIKKNLKTGVETGNIVQTKGMGASGSFKLAPGSKTKPEKKKKPNPIPEKQSADKPIKSQQKMKKHDTKDGKNVDKKKTSKSVTISISNTKKEVKKLKTIKENLTGANSSRLMKTPIKKKGGMMKRKSIGSIIKPPKMKPKAAVR